ncbi:hypothetical protein ACE6H2_005822 [Prunus campanulata]
MPPNRRAPPLARRELELLISDLYNRADGVWGPNGILRNLHDLVVVDEESSRANQVGNTPICMRTMLMK